MYHFSGMPLKLTMAPSICKPRLTLAITFADSTDGLTDATSNSGRAVGLWLKTSKQLTAARRTHRIECILHDTILPLKKIHESRSRNRKRPQALGDERLFKAQRDCGIDSRCTPGWKVAGGKRCRAQNQDG